MSEESFQELLDRSLPFWVNWITPERLAEIRELAEAATPGLWRVSYKGLTIKTGTEAGPESKSVATTYGCGALSNQQVIDSDYIAAVSPKTILALIDALEYYLEHVRIQGEQWGMQNEAYQGSIERLEDELEQWADALLWCSGSQDFAPGYSGDDYAPATKAGKARKGWLKLCQPLLNHYQRTRRKDRDDSI